MSTPSPSPEELERMRMKSGDIHDNRPLIVFLYRLLRDEITPGRLEQILLEAGIDQPVTTPRDNVFTNGWLATYAQDIAWRLTGWDAPWPTETVQVIAKNGLLSPEDIADLKEQWRAGQNDPGEITFPGEDGDSLGQG